MSRQNKVYFDDFGDTCPECDSTNISARGLSVDAAGKQYNMTCRDCGLEWIDEIEES